MTGIQLSGTLVLALQIGPNQICDDRDSCYTCDVHHFVRTPSGSIFLDDLQYHIRFVMEQRALVFGFSHAGLPPKVAV